MAAAVSNPFLMTWGSFTVGGTTERLITNVHHIVRDFHAWEASMDVLIRGTSAATFATNCAEMESEFTKRRQLILFTVDGSTTHTFNPAAGTNTGLNTWARCVKSGTPGADTDRSRLYTVTVGCALPAADASGRNLNPYRIDYAPNRQRTVTFTGTWTALTANKAKAQYESASPARFSSVLTSIDSGATWERIGENIDPDDQDQILTFTSIWKEVFVNQPGGSPDNSAIVDPMITWNRTISQPGDSGRGTILRMQEVSMHFECTVDKTVSTDLATLYTGTVRPYIRTQFTTLYQPASFAWLTEAYALSPFSNTLSVDVTFLAAIGASGVIMAIFTSRIVEGSGRILTGVWDQGLFSKYVDQGPATRKRFTVRAQTVLGDRRPTMRVGGSAAVAANNDLGDLDAAEDGGTSGWVLMENDSSATEKTFGQVGGDQITVTEIVEHIVHEYVVRPGDGGLTVPGLNRPVSREPGPGVPSVAVVTAPGATQYGTGVRR